MMWDLPDKNGGIRAEPLGPADEYRKQLRKPLVPEATSDRLSSINPHNSAGVVVTG